MLYTVTEFFRWIADRIQNYLDPFPQPALPGMRLGPTASEKNAVMVCGVNRLYALALTYFVDYSQIQFFTWDCLHQSLSWWEHFEVEIPRLAELGITQVWLPPPNKAAEPVSMLYRVHDPF